MRRRHLLAGILASLMILGAIAWAFSMLQYQHYWVERVTYRTPYGGYLVIQRPHETCGIPKEWAQQSALVPPESDRYAIYWYALKLPDNGNPLGLTISRDDALTLGLPQSTKVLLRHQLLGTGRPCSFGW